VLLIRKYPKNKKKKVKITIKISEQRKGRQIRQYVSDHRTMRYVCSLNLVIDDDNKSTVTITILRRFFSRGEILVNSNYPRDN